MTGMIRPVRGRLERVADRALERPVSAVVAVALVVRASVVLVLEALDVPSFTPDELGYVDIASWQLDGRLNELWSGYGTTLYDSTKAFSWQVTQLVRLLGPVLLAPRLLSVVYGTVTAGVTVAIALHLVRRHFALLAGLFVALLPSQVLWSSVGLRESMIWAVLALMSLLVARAARSSGAGAIMLQAAGVGLLFVLVSWLRPHTAVGALWCAVAALAVPAGRRALRVAAAGSVFVVAPLLVGLTVGGIGLFIRSTDELGTVRSYMRMQAESVIGEPEVLAPAVVEEPASELAAGVGSVLGTDSSLTEEPLSPGGAGDGMGAGAVGVEAGEPEVQVQPEVSHVIDRKSEIGEVEDDYIVDYEGRKVVVKNDLRSNFSALLRGLPAVTVRPVPWESGLSRPARAAGFESVVWAALFAFAGIGVWARRREIVPVLYPILLVVGLTVSMSVSQGNLGTAVRHRGQILFALAVMAVVGIQHVVDRSRESAGGRWVVKEEA